MNLTIPFRNAAPAMNGPTPKENASDLELPPGMRRVVTACKACGKSLGIQYPEAATFWKAKCPACAQTISIELVGGRKCLVFDVRGRRTVERIGLTDQRRRFFRARCYSCDETLVVPEAEAGRLKHCHKCGLEYTVREDVEVYYETAVRINDVLTTYREKVQESSGYVANKNTAFFLADETAPAGKPVNGVELSASLRAEYRQAVAEKEALARKLTSALEKVAAWEKNGRPDVENSPQPAEMGAQLQKITQERDLLQGEMELLKNKMRVHDDALRALDEEMGKTARLEARLATQEEGLRQSLEERKVLETKLVVLKEAACRLEERLARSDKVDVAPLHNRVRELELENSRLAAQVEEGRKQIKRLQDLEKELTHLRTAGGVTESNDREAWYCEEGEEACIRADNEIGLARRILGIRGQPTPERIKTAMRRRVKRYHPDMVTTLGLDLRDLAHKKMQEINRAYAILMKEYGHG